MGTHQRRVSPGGHQVWEIGRVMYIAVPVGDETPPGEARVHPNSHPPLLVVGWPPKDPRPWE